MAMPVDPEHRPEAAPPSGSEAELPRRVQSGSLLVSLVLTGVFDVGLALVAFNVAAGAGLGDQLAYVCSMIGPAIMLVITRVRSGTFGGVSIPILVFLMLSAAGSYLLAGVDPRPLIVKGAAVTGGFGLACLLATLLPKPLMFYFGARFATDGTREGRATGMGCGVTRTSDARSTSSPRSGVSPSWSRPRCGS